MNRLLELTKNDKIVIKEAEETAREIIKHANLEPEKNIKLEKFIEALNNLPELSENTMIEIDIKYQTGTAEENTTTYMTYEISGTRFLAEKTVFYYQFGTGSDHHTGPKWELTSFGDRYESENPHQFKECADILLQMGAEVEVQIQ